MRAAVAGICVFKTEVNLASRLRQISPFSAQKLTYLANKLQAVCGSPFHKEEVEEGLPVAFDLSQNYPNPFNPQTEISYSLPFDSDVNLRVFNILGEEVRELVNTHESAGSHTIIWDGRNNDGGQVASGTYFYKIHAGEFTDTKKMSLMK
jgi:hypothetical protein